MTNTLLIVDSATAACSAALVEGDRLIDERYELVGRGHAERLLPMIADLLGSARPDAILVDCGPGSFTGVRVGLAAARGLGIGWGVPVLGYSSMAAIAAAAADAGAQARLTVALHGGHGQLFVQDFAHAPLRPTDVLRSLLPAEAAAASDAAQVFGSGAETLVSLRGHGTHRDALPRAADARLLPEALRSLPARPLYGREPDAKPMP